MAMKTRFFFLFAVLLMALIVQAEDTVSFRGIVLDETGKPVAGAQVYFEEGILKPENIRTAGEDGRFELPVPSGKSIQWMSVYALGPDKQHLGESRPKLKEGSFDIPGMTVTLKKARIITGTVVDAEGQPVEGALVGGVDQTPYPSFTKTDKDGNFRFAYPDDDVEPMQQVFAYHEKFGLDFLCTEELEKYRGKIPPEKKSDGPFHLTLQPLKKFKFRVVDEQKHPIPGCEVYPWLVRKEGQKDCFNTGYVSDLLAGKTDVDGTVVVISIAGNTRFSADGPKEGVVDADGKRVFYGDDDKTMDEFDKSDSIPTFVLKRKGNVKGTVRRSDGTPVPWSWITIKRHNACGHGIRFTNVKGQFVIDWNADEIVDIGVESTLGATPGVFAFNVGDGIEEKRLDFVLQKGIRLHGTVYDPDGKPSEQYQIFLHEKCPEDILKKIMQQNLPSLGKTGSDSCPPDGCPTGVVIRQTSDYGEPGSEGKYEYFLPAVARKYDFSVSSYADPEWGFRQEDFTVKGDEQEIRLDFHLKKLEEEEIVAPQ